MKVTMQSSRLISLLVSSVKLVPPFKKPNFNTKVNLKYNVTLTRAGKVKVTNKGHNVVEVIKVYQLISLEICQVLAETPLVQ